MTQQSPLATNEGDTLTLSELRVGTHLKQNLTLLRSPLHLVDHIFGLKSTADRIAFAHTLVEQPQLLGYEINSSEASRSHASYDKLKRFIDIVVASALLLVLLPVFLLTSIAILIESGAPVLYFQPRVGRKGSTFRFYKFRSMVKNADALKQQLMDQNEAVGPNFKMRNDPRVTKVGKVIRRLSIDELPQLLDVVRGHMSLIGPRPLLGNEASCLGDRYSHRHEIKPGLMCLREVCGRSALSFNEWMELDLLYIQARSLKTDLRILMKAVQVILTADNAY